MAELRDVLVIYGGKSTEHEISCRSAAFVLKHLDRSKYRIHTLAIDKDGTWLPQNTDLLLESAKGAVPIDRTRMGQPSLPVRAERGNDPGSKLLALSTHGLGGGLKPVDPRSLVVFPVLHGTNGEDGTLQGLLEMAEVAFVGPDTLGSAIGMDKVVSKRLAQAKGVPVVPWIDVRAQFWGSEGERLLSEAANAFGFPLFVKPARLGSSVGVSKAKDADQLKKACEHALSFDDRIMIEKGLNVREIEVAALGNYDPLVSVPGEVVAHGDFYSYDAKYLDASGSHSEIPAKLSKSQVDEAQTLAKTIFSALELFGMARIDLFLEKRTEKFYFNEVNTIPGFTEISQYPLLWQASGLSPTELLNRLIGLALERQSTKLRLARTR